MKDNDYVHLFSTLKDHDWLDLLIKSLDRSNVDGIDMPTFPNSHVQSAYVGSSGKEALEDAFIFYKQVKTFAKRLRVPLDQHTRALDFGCGWGRHYRFFLKDLSTRHFLGVDIDDSAIHLCRETIKAGQFERCDILPPLRFAKGSFDMIYSYSVFSHLSEEVHRKWISEFSRILRPGGMLIVSALSRAHVLVWEKYLNSSNQHYAEALEKSGFEAKRAFEKLDKGEYLYCPIGGGGVRDNTFYGEAIMGPRYVEREWTHFLAFVDYVDDPSRGQQALIIMQKPG